MTGLRLFLFCLAAVACAADGAGAEVNSVKNNPFGVLEFLQWDHDWNSHQYASEEQLLKAVRMMKNAGVGMVRMDFLWQDIEPERGCFDFAKYDRIVDILNANGIGILGILDYAADWASPEKAWNVPPADNSAFIAFARATAGRYKGRVRYWEVWNEPDSPVYWKAQDGLVAYSGLLKDTYRALKEIDPGCRVINGGLTNELCNVNRLYDNGCREYFDALNIHIFENPVSAGADKRLAAYVKACAKVMKRNGDGGKKIWVTEIGCPGVLPGNKSKQWWLGANPGEKEQAAWVAQALGILLAHPQVEKVFWAFFRDTNSHWKDGTDYLGLVRNDFSRKPALGSYERAYQAWRSRGKK